MNYYPSVILLLVHFYSSSLCVRAVLKPPCFQVAFGLFSSEPFPSKQELSFIQSLNWTQNSEFQKSADNFMYIHSLESFCTLSFIHHWATRGKSCSPCIYDSVWNWRILENSQETLCLISNPFPNKIPRPSEFCSTWSIETILINNGWTSKDLYLVYGLHE